MGIMFEYTCHRCGRPAQWVRHSQISEVRYFCETHASNEEDFLIQAPHYFWEELYGETHRKGHVHIEHPIELPGYEGTLRTLAEDIHRLRYDKVVEFYHHALTELHRQATNDRELGHPQLAQLLDEAAGDVLDLRELFSRIYALCRPYMPGAP